MSTTGGDYPNARDSRALTEDEWRASLPSLGYGNMGLSQPPAAPSAPPSVAPFSTQPRTWAIAPTSSSTPWAWWLVVTPLILVLVLGSALVAQSGLLSDPSALTVEAAVTLLLGWLAVLLFAPVVRIAVTVWIGHADRQALVRLGHRTTASPWWNVIDPLVYLIVRTVHATRESGTGSGPLTAYLCIYIIPAVIAPIAVLIAGSL